MNRREFVRNTVGGASALFAMGEARGRGASSSEQTNDASEAEAQRDEPRPNILFIMTDQQRCDCVGANGNNIIQTPHIDALAKSGANFSHAFVQAPVCVPSRACFFTGRYAHAHRNRVNYTDLDPSETLMQARLQQAGYTTCLVGKTHLYYDYPPTRDAAKATGFDNVDLHDGARSTDAWSDYARWRGENDPMAQQCYYRDTVGDSQDSQNPFRTRIDDAYTDTTWTGQQTRARLRELAAGGKPFFLFSSYWKPHSPFEVPSPFDDLYNGVDFDLPRAETLESMHQLPPPVQSLALRGNNPPYNMDRDRLQWIYRSYYGSITHIDREVGKTIETLAELGLSENTIVVFASDHGDQLLEHGIMGKNVFYDASTRAPLTIHYPQRIRAGNYDALVESIDLLPTLFDLIGLETPYAAHGRSLMPLIGNNATDSYEERDSVFCENVIPEVFSKSFFFEKGKGVRGIRHPDAKMVRTRKWKYNYYPDGHAELFDLENDPMEYGNLADDPAHRATRNELQDRILHWLTTATETDQIAPRWLI